MSFIKSIAQAFTSQIYASALLLIVAIVTARTLGVHDRGLYSLFFTTTGLLGNLLTLGFAQANVYYLNKEPKPLGVIMSNTLLFFFLLFCIIFFTCGLFGNLISITLLHTKSLLLSVMLGFSVIIYVVDTTLGSISLGTHHVRLYTDNLAFQASLILLGTLALYVLTPSLHTAIFLRLIGFSIVLILYIYRLHYTTKISYHKPSKSLLSKQFKFGIKNYLQNVIGLLNYRVYMYALLFTSGAHSVGLFSVSLVLIECIRLIPNSVGTVLLPKLTNTRNNEVSSLITLNILMITLPITLIILIILTIFSPILIKFIFGYKYIKCANAFRIMVTGSWLATCYQILTRYFTSKSKQIYSILCGLSALLIAVTSSLVLCPRIGLTGAAYAFLLSNMSAGVMMLGCFIKEAKLKPEHLSTSAKQSWQNIIKPLLTKKT